MNEQNTSPNARPPQSIRSPATQTLNSKGGSTELTCNSTPCESNLTGQKPLSIQCSNSKNICRICFSGEEAGKLVKFCHCLGSIELCHHHCLVHWIHTSNVTACELCGYQYRLNQRPIRLLRWQCPPFQPQEHFFLAIYLVAWLTLAGSVTWLCFVIFGDDPMYRESELAPLIYGLYGLIAGASTGIIIFETIFILKPFLQGIRHYNQATEVQPYDSSASGLFSLEAISTRDSSTYEPIIIPLPLRTEMQYQMSNPYRGVQFFQHRILPLTSLMQLRNSEINIQRHNHLIQQTDYHDLPSTDDDQSSPVLVSQL